MNKTCFPILLGDRTQTRHMYAGERGDGKGPAVLPALTHDCKYADTKSLLDNAEGWFGDIKKQDGA